MYDSKIVDIQVKVVEVAFKKTWEVSLYATNTKAHAIVQITTEDGIKGYGEASPAASFMGESGYTIEAVIQNHLKSALIGQNVFAISKINHIMDRQISLNTAAKAAVDIALHDAVGKSLGIPVYKLLGGKFRDELRLAWSIGLQDIEGSVAEARQRLNEGYSEIKMKVGKDIKKDARLIVKLRELIGEDVPLRLDANQGFNPSDAVLLIKSVGNKTVDIFEQPVPKWDIEGMRFVRENAYGMKIMADESISCLNDMKKLMAYGAADAFNIKVGKVGGLYRACQIAAHVEAAGLEACAGSNIELGIGEAASIHFVTSQAALSRPCDMMCGSELHDRELITNPFPIVNGMVQCPDTPGLGVEVDEAIFA